MDVERERVLSVLSSKTTWTSPIEHNYRSDAQENALRVGRPDSRAFVARRRPERWWQLGSGTGRDFECNGVSLLNASVSSRSMNYTMLGSLCHKVFVTIFLEVDTRCPGWMAIAILKPALGNIQEKSHQKYLSEWSCQGVLLFLYLSWVSRN